VNPPAHTLVIGLGCKSGCSTDTLLELIEQQLKAYGTDLSAIDALTSIEHKRAEPGLLELAERLEKPLVLFNALHLSAFERQLSHRSQASFDSTGCWGVAESAALALAVQLGGGNTGLLIKRQNNAEATFALAGSTAHPENP
jgi:cobalt-precorrin 5A hydrolase